MKVTMIIPNCSKMDALEKLTMGYDYEQLIRGDYIQTMVLYYTKKIALADIKGWKKPKDVIFEKGW